LWWLSKKKPTTPASIKLQNICHQSHTKALSASAKQNRKDFERAMADAKDCPALAANADATARAIHIQWAISLIEQPRTNLSVRTNCAKALCKAFTGTYIAGWCH
jgi:hypothetical protein